MIPAALARSELDPEWDGSIARTEDYQRAQTQGLIVNPDTGLREAGSSRRVVHCSETLLVENSAVSAAELGPSGYESRYQVVLPYFGLFEYHVGQRSCQVDTACSLFVTRDREYHDVHPVAGIGHAGIVISLSEDLVDELANEPRAGSAFVEMVRPATQRLKLLTHHALRVFDTNAEHLFVQEWALISLMEAFCSRPKGRARRSGAVERAKLLLHSSGCERLSLEEIAREVGFSPAYLTSEFTRSEGIPLYRYHLNLRMNRALVELPHCDDITRLALDLGFNSHSHFTLTFRRHFGVTPSEYRHGKTVDRSLALQAIKASRGFFANMRRAG
jgi:AraC-like DNA-binding protein